MKKKKKKMKISLIYILKRGEWSVNVKLLQSNKIDLGISLGWKVSIS
jgi:hypothetical protein